jgi:phospholipase/lecithinase/hemolysin
MADRPLYSRLVVLGDSLSDSGNAFVLLGEVEKRPFEPIPDAPYARGFPHFSNGQTWVEQLAETLGLGVSTGPALKNPRVFSNYAVGGARARGVEPFDLNNQVELFLKDFDEAPKNALYVVYAGGNDLRDALSVLADYPDPTSVSAAILTKALAAIGETITKLANAGAQTFLVPNAPPLDLVPAVRSQDETVREAARLLSTQFNNELEKTLLALEANPNLAVTIIRLDVSTLFTNLVTDPGEASPLEVEKPCITPGTIDHPFCEQPDEYLFWDYIHPTEKGHALLAEAAQQALRLAQR